MQLSGLASGMDTGSVVSSLVASSRAPAESAILQKKQSNNAQISALGKLTSALEGLKTAATALSDTDALRSVSASTSNDAFNISATSATFKGSINVEVISKAATHRLASTSVSTEDSNLGGGSITIDNAAGDSFSLNIDAASSSLSDIADAINDSGDNIGVQATVVKESTGNYRLLLSANSPGTDSALTLSFSDDDGDLTDGAGLSQMLDPVTASFDELSAASDAVIDLDGLTITRSGNSIDDAIEGLSIDISATKVGDTSVFTVSEDRAAKKQKVQDFADAYNKFRSVLDAESVDGGALQGDSISRGIAASLRSAFTSEVNGLEMGSSRLFDAGISIDRYGKADIDTTTFDTVLDADADILQKLFAGDDGIASKMVSKLEGYLDTSDGTLQNRQDSILKSQERMDDRLADLDRRMASYESRLRSQFTAMEQMISKFNTMGSFLSGLTPISYQ